MVKATRKGATRMADVPPHVLAQLDAGKIEAVTLAENLATDFATLMASTMPDLAELASQFDTKVGVTKRMAQAAQIISSHSGQDRLEWLSKHPSDLLRGWGAYLLALDNRKSLSDKLVAMRPFADDTHFGVREWAWLALRPEIALAPEQAIEALVPFTYEDSEYLRRFASEAIRPRGIWAAHIKLLKDTPECGRVVIEPLRGDPSRYVQDSVGNWLNDAYKTNPMWVGTLCKHWMKENSGNATKYIVKRALRNQK